MKAPILAAGALLIAALPALAHDGHDHAAAAPGATAAASPRIAVHSDLFELVGVVERGGLTLYLDRFASNEPVADARIEFESGPHQGTAARQEGGSYRIQFDGLADAGQRAFAFTVVAGADSDLLAAELDIHAVDGPADAPRATWKRWGLWAGGGVALALAAAVATLRVRNRKVPA